MKKSLSLFVLVVFIALIFTACNNDPAHVHEWGEWEATTEATCTKDGVATRKCKTCGNLDKETQVIKALGHDWGEGTVKAEATCAAEGKKEYTCSRCTETKTEPIAKADHSYGDLQTKAATCKEDGKEYRICSVCGDEKVEKVLPKTDSHTWDTGVVTKAATCGEAGVKTYTCSVCETTKTEEIAATDEHSYGEEQTKAATCKEEGKKYQVCSVCGDEKVNSTIAKVAHTFDSGVITTEPTCKDTGVKTYTCSVCGETETETVPVDSTKHVYSWVTDTEATFTKARTEKEVCSVCDEVKSTRVTDEYKSMKGYWKTSLSEFMLEGTGASEGWIYCSFGDDSSDTIEGDEIISVDTGEKYGMSESFTYSWTADDSLGERTALNHSSGMIGGKALAVVGSTIKSENDETSKDTLTLSLDVGKEVVSCVFERISEEPHEHTLSDNPVYTPFSLSNDYHTTPTQCEGDLHPQFGYVSYHRYDETAENPEVCLDCGAVRLY